MICAGAQRRDLSWIQMPLHPEGDLRLIGSDSKMRVLGIYPHLREKMGKIDCFRVLAVAKI